MPQRWKEEKFIQGDPGTQFYGNTLCLAGGSQRQQSAQ